ncbi:MAG: hypothetical protein IPH75_09630 [bacterium]|nr:hypothetical protein [bacterium]
MTLNKVTYMLSDPGKFGMRMLIAGGAGLILSILGWVLDADRFFHAYLTAFVFWTSIGLGALFFTMLHHLVGARWSVVIRRISESIMMVLPYMAALFIPALIGMHSLYHWSHADAVAHDALLQAKSGYLNQTFFIIRTVFFFAIWSLLAIKLHKLSLKQDKGDTQAIGDAMRKTSAWGMLLFAVTVTYAGYDWLMSLNPHWFSTIFGVYFFAGGLLSVIAFMTLIALALRRKGILADTITVEHYHDLGKLMFAFTVFWTYIGFSQYFLIWYGNVPEETVWYLARWEGSWQFVSMVILFGHFVLPFVALLFRATKRTPIALTLIGCWILLMHWVDMYWLVYPTLLKEGASINWIEPATMLFIGGVFLWGFWGRFSRHPLIPVQDPKLAGSINHVNPF